MAVLLLGPNVPVECVEDARHGRQKDEGGSVNAVDDCQALRDLSCRWLCLFEGTV